MEALKEQRAAGAAASGRIRRYRGLPSCSTEQFGETEKLRGLGPRNTCGEASTSGERKVWSGVGEGRKNPIAERDFEIAFEAGDGKEERERVEEEFRRKVEH